MKQLFHRLLLVLFAVVLSLGAAELGLRLLKEKSSTLASKLPYFDRSRFRYISQPGRDHPWTAAKMPALHIAVIGDSITAGAGVLPYDRYGNRLEALLNLNEGVTPALVSTFARPGSSTFQQTSLLREALAQDPDIVILGICTNDLEDWNNPTEFKAWRNQAIPLPPPASMRWSRILTWLHGRMEALRTAHAHVEYYRRLYDESYSGRHLFDQALGEFHDACVEAGVPLIAVLFPMLSRDLREERYPFGFVREAQTAMLAAHDIFTFDLWPLFEGKETMRLEVFPGIDGHPNEIAHCLASEGIYRFLLEKGYLGDEYRARDPESQFDYWKALHQIMQGQQPTGH